MGMNLSFDLLLFSYLHTHYSGSMLGVRDAALRGKVLLPMMITIHLEAGRAASVLLTLGLTEWSFSVLYMSKHIKRRWHLNILEPSNKLLKYFRFFSFIYCKFGSCTKKKIKLQAF